MDALVVTPDRGLAGWTVLTLREAGWTVRAVATPAAAQVVVADWTPAVVVVDAAVGVRRGTWIEGFGDVGARVVVVSMRHRDGDLEHALSAGADAYLALPVGPHELVARLRAVARRGAIAAVAVPLPVTVGRLTLDRAASRISIGATEVPVTAREVLVLEALMVAAPHVVPRDELVRALWQADPDGPGVDVVVRRLRTRLDAAEGWRRIESVRGVGFRLVDEDEADRRRAFTQPSVVGHESFDRSRERVLP